MTNQYGYLSSKIKQIEHKVILLQAENAEYIEKIQENNQKTAECLSALRQNNKILDMLGYNLTSIGEMARNIEESLIIIPNPAESHTLNKIA